MNLFTWLKSLNPTRILQYFNYSCFSVLILFSCSPALEKADNQSAFLIGKGTGIDGPTLLVHDLQATRNYFSDTLGFRLPEEFNSGEYAGTHWVAAQFPDFSSFKFLAINDTLTADNVPEFIKSFLDKQEGARMFSLTSSSVDSTNWWLTSQGFQLDSIVSFRKYEEVENNWDGDDGGPHFKRLDFDINNPSRVLPRFTENFDNWSIAAQTRWKTFYSYTRSFNHQPNGVLGTSFIKIAVENLDEQVASYQKMGFNLINKDEDQKIARFEVVRNQEIQLVAPQSDSDNISKFLKKRGSGVFSIGFDVRNIQSTYDTLSQKLPKQALIYDSVAQRITVPREFGKGLIIEFIQEPEDQARLAKMFELGEKLDTAASNNASGMYQKYCSLCHGDDRKGYKADHAPSLSSKSLLATSRNNNFMRYTIQHGRKGTAMGGYLKRQGGPLDYIDIELILQWLYESAEVDSAIKVSREPVSGDINLGSKIYQNRCSVCHGKEGEGITAPALGNSMLLATATDGFLKYAIENGRDGTPMVAFKDSLSTDEINAVTAYLRSRASGWDIPKLDTIKIPSPDEYVLNPDRPNPEFELREGMFLSAEQLNKAMEDSLKIIILDARSEVAWKQTHIPGSAPVPYYKDPDDFIEDIPNNDTWVVVYCACPHAASRRVVKTLRRFGFKNTAILDEGILVWAELGYPVNHGN